MTPSARCVTRRDVLSAGVAVVATAASPRPVHGGGRVRAYLASGVGVASLLDSPDWRRHFEDIFSGLDAVFAKAPDRDAMLEGALGADLVYLSIHSNFDVIGMGSDEPIRIAEIVRKRRALGHTPRLMVVAGCKTIDGDTRTTLPSAFGIHDGDRGAAYVGFTLPIGGRNADAFFRIFFAHWLKPRETGDWRTLAEARTDALAMMARLNALADENAAVGGDIAGGKMTFGYAVKLTGQQVTIIGDADLTFPMLAAPPATTGDRKAGDDGPRRIGAPPRVGETAAPPRPAVARPTNTGGAAGSGDADAINRMLRR